MGSSRASEEGWGRVSEQEQPRERMNRVGVGWEQDAWEEGEARTSQQGQEWEE